MNNNIMAARKTSATTSETRRSIAAVIAASATHSINPIAPSSLDVSAGTDDPLWDFCSTLCLICDPSTGLSTERIQESLQYLANQTKQYGDFDTVMKAYQCRMVLFQQLSNRFLALSGSNQANPTVASAFMSLSIEAQREFEESHDNYRKWKKLASEEEIENIRRNRQECAYGVRPKY